MNGAAQFIAGVGRTIVLNSSPTEYRSTRYCMLMPWNILYSWLADRIFPTFSYDKRAVKKFDF